jgi:hypothetical protein
MRCRLIEASGGGERRDRAPVREEFGPRTRASSTRVLPLIRARPFGPARGWGRPIRSERLQFPCCTPKMHYACTFCEGHAPILLPLVPEVRGASSASERISSSPISFRLSPPSRTAAMPHVPHEARGCAEMHLHLASTCALGIGEGDTLWECALRILDPAASSPRTLQRCFSS